MSTVFSPEINMGLYPEWLETDGLGGFAMGSTDGIPRRRYHSLLTSSLHPPIDRFNLVNTVEVFVHNEGERYPLSSFLYNSGVVHPSVGHRVSSYIDDRVIPTWLHRLPSGIYIESSVFMSRQYPGTFMSWKLTSAEKAIKLTVRPLLSGRNYHWLNRANDLLRFDSRTDGDAVRWHLYPNIPGITARSTGKFTYNPVWYYDFLYEEERARGFDAVEDLASPGEFSWVLEPDDEALLAFMVEDDDSDRFCQKGAELSRTVDSIRTSEVRRRSSFPSALERAGDEYLVKRADAKTIIAGYPWFTDWGRDTFISVRGLCLATNRLSEAEQIFLAWTDAVSDGMIPNRFPDEGGEPEFNSVDASLWFIVSAYEFLQKAEELKYKIGTDTRERLEQAILAILESYYNGTRFYIRADEEDGLLYAGSYGSQLTWMDAAFDGFAFTPRSGKPVEIQALWINALQIGSKISRKWSKPAKLALASFEPRFWDEQQNCLFDVVDVNGTRNVADPRLRPNQIFAVGGLPFPVLKGDKAASVVAAVERHLVTKLGLRSLAPFEREYKAQYQGGDYERCSAYHQGTVWAWLLGPFIEAWVRVHRSTQKAKRQAETQFFDPLMNEIGCAGIGHLPEIADGSDPHYPRGCPFQAWSVAEALRVGIDVLGCLRKETASEEKVARKATAVKKQPSASRARVKTRGQK